MRKTAAENTLIARSLRNRQLVCNGLAWEAQQIGNPERAQDMRNEAASCMQLACGFEVEAHAAHAAKMRKQAANIHAAQTAENNTQAAQAAADKNRKQAAHAAPAVSHAAKRAEVHAADAALCYCDACRGSFSLKECGRG